MLGAGARFLGLLIRGQARLGVPTGTYARALAVAVRPHFFVLPCAACLAGAAVAPGPASLARVGVAAVAVGVAWGVGQLLNDLVDLEADAVDAPDRPAVRGLLPEGPTALVAVALGVAVTVALALTHPLGWLLAIVSAALMLVYSPAKGIPALGNLTHGALMAWLCLLGAGVAAPRVDLIEVAREAWPAIACVGALAALYLQGNYEKDRAGDARAGYRTLATLLGVRGSALVRVAVGAAIYGLGWRADLVASPTALGLWALSAALLLASVARAATGGDGASALSGYRFTVHSTATGLIALTPQALGPGGAVALLAFATLLIEIAFQQSRNP